MATGITPSGTVHIGNLRETMTADLIFKILKKEDRKAELVYIADDFDRLRRRYPFLPKSFEKYVGWPLADIPDPEGCHQNYAEHFLEPFFKSMKELGIKMKRLSAHQMYQNGQYTKQITTALKKRDQIKEILEKISHRSIAPDWQPFEPLCEKCGRIDQAKITGIDYDRSMVNYQCACGHKGEADYSKGGGKLQWRIDWAARWQILGVTVEPFGKDHAAAGGSYDTAKAISKQIFNYNPPYPIPYEFISLKGQKGKMASSVGNIISIKELLEVVPPEIIRYLFATTQPKRHIEFDPGDGLIRLINQYSQLEDEAETGKLTREKKIVYQLCQMGKEALPASSFRHLAEVYQAAQGKFREIIRILKQTGYQKDLQDKKALKEQLNRVKTWLEKYAPKKYKFEVKKRLPQVKLSEEQKELLKILADRLEEKDLTAEEIHNLIYEKGEELNLSPRARFETVYKVLIAKSSGPKAGWFIDILDRDFVIERFREAV